MNVAGRYIANKTVTNAMVRTIAVVMASTCQENMASRRLRDLVGEPYKYGDSIADIMRVIRLGVNGSKMPASTTLTPEQLADLASLFEQSTPHHGELTNAQRYQRAIGNLPKRP